MKRLLKWIGSPPEVDVYTVLFILAVGIVVLAAGAPQGYGG